MALLTEKQIVELVEMASVPIYLYDKIFEWNKKQQPAQFYPDWDNAPEKATQAVVNSFWVDANGDTFGVYKTYYYRPAPVITPHPHAEILAKYADVAARRVDPWVEFEFKHKFNKDWTVFICHPHFAVDYDYRHIGDNK